MFERGLDSLCLLLCCLFLLVLRGCVDLLITCLFKCSCFLGFKCLFSWCALVYVMVC